MKNSSTAPKIGNRLQLGYLEGGTALYPAGTPIKERMLKDFEVVLITEGHPTYETQYGKFPLKPGTILLTHPGQHETCHWDTHHKTRCAFFRFSIEEIPGDWANIGDWPYCQRRPARILSEVFWYIIEQAALHANPPTQQPSNSIHRLLENFLDLYLKPYKTPKHLLLSNFTEPVRRAINYMYERFEGFTFKPFTLDHLASDIGISKTHLCRLFQTELNLSPMRVCRLMQLQLAVSMLTRSNRTIKEIAKHCGFKDPLYFSRSFTRTFGASPNQIRHNMQNGAPPPPALLPYSIRPHLNYR